MLGDAADALAESVDFNVWPENWHALIVFLSSTTQWRHGQNGSATGLDYTGVQVVMQMQDVKNKATAFEGLQIMESEVLRVWSEQ